MALSDPFDNTAPVLKSLGATAFDNTAPGAMTVPGAAFDNTSPVAASLGATAFDNTSPVTKLPVPELTATVCSTTNVNLGVSLPGQVIDGYTLLGGAGETILLTGQTTAHQNGVHDTAVFDSSGIASRNDAANSSAELIGLIVKVANGTANKGKRFKCSNLTTITIGTTAINFVDQAATPKTV